MHLQFSSAQSVSSVWLFATPWTAARQASLSITNSQSSLKFIELLKLVMPSNHLIFCCPLLLLPSMFLSIRVFTNESVLHIRWPKYWSFCFSISPSNEYSGLISFRIDWFDLLAEKLKRVVVIKWLNQGEWIFHSPLPMSSSPKPPDTSIFNRVRFIGSLQRGSHRLKENHGSST